MRARIPLGLPRPQRVQALLPVAFLLLALATGIVAMLARTLAQDVRREVEYEANVARQTNEMCGAKTGQIIPPTLQHPIVFAVLRRASHQLALSFGITAITLFATIYIAILIFIFQVLLV
ncbi:unnamed protein product [Tilletia controversa]|uniref:Uncharacterized protein n=1 Tax=Tilletia controversa TaxID=13291 RepID=A0A8X7MN65_9BASI|nr:hypothetical protein CF328_g5850 [Tilletia controversa]KAE8242813.1 hypothetical protein A4X06_0g6749 [Tilletia controversa]CAD6968344.1 unnamed protein product [Tilletia controversa]CAD6974281.1 unnamed protein product [Tilletia controversa]